MLRLCQGSVDSTLIDSHLLHYSTGLYYIVYSIYSKYKILQHGHSLTLYKHPSRDDRLENMLCSPGTAGHCEIIAESMVVINIPVNPRQIYWVFFCYVTIKPSVIVSIVKKVSCVIYLLQDTNLCFL